MKCKIIMLVVFLGLSFAVIAQADEKSSGAVSDQAAAVEAGNKICPVSGEKVGQMGDIVQIEHKGKIYNLCCAMCKNDFDKNPDKYTKIAEDEVAGAMQENK